MSLALAVALASAPASFPACSWDRPGHNPFTGDLVAAVDRYADIPAPVRARLKARMTARQYDEIVDIRRDRIEGRKASYGAEIRDMHFGSGQVCGSVTRARWPAHALERGLVYCEDGHCLLVPTVCRNLSRIQRGGPAVAGAGGDADRGRGTVPAAAAGGAAVPGAAGATPPTAAAAGPSAPGGTGEGLAGHDLAAAPDSFARGAAPQGGLGEAGAADAGNPDPSGRGSLDLSQVRAVGDAPSARGPGGSGPWGGNGQVPEPLPGVRPSMSGIAWVSGQGVGEGPVVPGGDRPTSPVPEPGTLLLWALGLAGLGPLLRRRLGRS